MPEKTEKFNYQAITVNNEALTPEDFRGVAAGSKSGKVAHVFIWGEIGGWWGVYGQEVFRILAGQSPDEIRVYISTHGGDAKVGFEIYNLLRGHSARVVTYNFSLCASAGTIIHAAGDDGFRICAPTSIYMIHEGRPGMYGYYSEDEIDSLLRMTRAFNDRIAAVYAELTGRTMEVEKAEMKREVWFTASEAVAAGYVDRAELVSVPFHLAKITEEEFYSEYAEHTANHARAEMAGVGFVASAKFSPKPSSKMNPIVSKVAGFFAEKLGLKFTNSKGEEVSPEKVAALVTEETEKDFKSAIAPGVESAIQAAMTQAMAGRIEEVRKEVKSEYEAEAEKLREEMKSIRNEMAKMKAPGSSGAHGNTETGTAPNTPGATSEEEEVAARMGSEAQLSVLAASGLIDTAAIERIARNAVKQSRSKEN